MVDVHVSYDQQRLQQIIRSLRDEADGKELRKEMTANIRSAAEPAVVEVRTKVLALQHVPSEVKAQVASKVQLNVRGGKSAGVRAQVSRSAGRGFKNAARAFNAPGGWRHRAWGRNVWFQQQSSNPGFWQETFERKKPQLASAVMDAVEAMARRIAGRH